MVNRNVLKKLSDNELEKYLKEDNRFVPEAIQIAFEILEERGKHFSDEDKLRIQEIITRKKDIEEQKKIEEQELQKDYITEDTNAIRLHSRGLIVFFSFFFGFISGAILLGLNFFKLKKYQDGFGIIFLGLIYTVVQYFGLSVMYKMKTDTEFTSYRKSPELLFTILGSLIIYFIWIETIKKLPYRSESLLIPIILGLIMSGIIYVNYNGYLPSYFFVSFAR